MKKKAFAIIVVLAMAALGVGIFTAASAHTDGGKDIRFRAYASGAQETSNVVTSTTGRVDVKFDRRLSQVHARLRVNNGTAITAAHFHCGRAGEDGGVVLGLYGAAPSNVNGVLVDQTFTNVDFSTATCEVPINNVASLAFAMMEGLVYVNVHSTANPGGEVRGQLLQRIN